MVEQALRDRKAITTHHYEVRPKVARIIKSTELDKMTNIFRSIPLPTLGMGRVHETLRIDWQQWFVEALFDHCGNLSPELQVDPNFIDKFERRFRTCADY